MKFKEFLTELAMPEVSLMARDVAVEEEINRQLEMGLKDVILSPQIGLYKIRKMLNRFGYDLPTSYVPDQDGDEVVLDMHGSDSLLYVLYYQTDDGNYDFYALIDDDEGIEEILSKDEELEKEE
jgi:hypothetical protein